MVLLLTVDVDDGLSLWLWELSGRGRTVRQQVALVRQLRLKAVVLVRAEGWFLSRGRCGRESLGRWYCFVDDGDSRWYGAVVVLVKGGCDVKVD